MIVVDASVLVEVLLSLPAVGELLGRNPTVFSVPTPPAADCDYVADGSDERK